MEMESIGSAIGRKEDSLGITCAGSLADSPFEETAFLDWRLGFKRVERRKAREDLFFGTGYDSDTQLILPRSSFAYDTHGINELNRMDML